MVSCFILAHIDRPHKHIKLGTSAVIRDLCKLLNYELIKVGRDLIVLAQELPRIVNLPERKLH